MARLINGIHHITAIASDPQKNLDFYTQALGLKLVKKTINFDSPDVYHFYFGDEVGSPGTVLTFFPFTGAGRGRKGLGEVTFTAFAIAEQSIGYWKDRLKRLGIMLSDTQERFGHPVLRFEDHDGMGIELVGVAIDERLGWGGGSVPENHAIKGFFGATLNLSEKNLTEKLLTKVLDYNFVGEEKGNRFRYKVDGKPGEVIDIVLNTPGERSLQGAGTVHHIAFRTENTTTQAQIQQKLFEFGQQATQVKDRNYFKSIYFREPGGILFEVATDDPGFVIDEPVDQLGEDLKLPKWAAFQRRQIVERLQKVHLNYDKKWSR